MTSNDYTLINWLMSSSGSFLLGSLGDNREGVESRAKFIGQSIIDHAVAVEERLLMEFRGNNLQIEMGLSVITFEGSMASVLVGNVLHFYCNGF